MTGQRRQVFGPVSLHVVRAEDVLPAFLARNGRESRLGPRPLLRRCPGIADQVNGGQTYKAGDEERVLPRMRSPRKLAVMLARQRSA